MRPAVTTSRALCVLFCLLPAVGSGAQAQEVGPESPEVLPQVSFQGLFYLTYETGEEDGRDYSRFNIHRAYLTSRVRVLPRLSGRITFDTSQDHEGDGRGDMEVRLKYAYAEYDVGSWGKLRDVSLEGGIVHMVWLDFEEHVNLYRMRGEMFMERSGMFNSADFGLTLHGGIGEELPDEFKEEVSSHYAARYGSFALGVYNGGGYHGEEENENKVLQGRLTLRPLPDRIPGLQLSGLMIHGKGNRPGEDDAVPDWRAYDLMLSYQFPAGALTAQYAWGRGNQRGTWFEPGNVSEATDYDGYSFFGEYRIGRSWRLVGGFDALDRTPAGSDFSFDRLHAGVGYELGARNILLLDVGRRSWDEPDLETDTRFQVVMQLSF